MSKMSAHAKLQAYKAYQSFLAGNAGSRIRITHAELADIVRVRGCDEDHLVTLPVEVLVAEGRVAA